jgi:AraC family transcriptional regulator
MLPSHAHELSHFCFVLAGNYQEQLAGKVFERRPTSLVFYPPDTSHGEQHFTYGRHLLVEIDRHSLDRVREYGALLNEPMLVGGDAPLWLAAAMYREFSARDSFSALVLESIATELMIHASRQNSRRGERKPPRWLQQVKDFLSVNFAEPPGLSEIAAAAGVHPTHLARVFRQFEGCTLGDYVRTVRISFARRRMLESEDPLVEIALAAGFADQTHFTRSFKRVTGMTPGQFRAVFGSR